MADADYGYVGTVRAKSLCTKRRRSWRKTFRKSGPLMRLIELIRSHGDWVEPVVQD